MKNELIININSIEKVKKFCDMTTKFSEDIDLTSGRYVTNAKSIMGIFALNLAEDMLVTIHTSDADVLKRFQECMREFEA